MIHWIVLTPLFHVVFFFNDTATTEIYTLSLHDALPIWATNCASRSPRHRSMPQPTRRWSTRSEEHTSELQSPKDLVCRFLLEKKKFMNSDLREEGSRVLLIRTVIGICTG